MLPLDACMVNHGQQSHAKQGKKDAIDLVQVRINACVWGKDMKINATFD